MNNNRVYTIGHSTLPITAFIQLLNDFGISCVADVRSTPYSRYALQYNREELAATLKDHGLQYVFLGEEFGARRNDRTLYSSEGWLDFGRTRKSSKFLNGVRRIRNGSSRGYKIALMCTEKHAI